MVSKGIKVARRVGCRRAPPTRPGLCCRPGTGTDHGFGCCARVVSASRHEIWFNVKSRTRGAGDPYCMYEDQLSGVLLGPALLPDVQRAHRSGTDTTPPRPGAQLARSTAKGMILPAKATSIVARHVHGRCTELSPRRVTPPPGGQGRGNLFKAQIEFIGRRSAAYGADRIHLV